jgi:hypothetical protein
MDTRREETGLDYRVVGRHDDHSRAHLAFFRTNGVWALALDFEYSGALDDSPSDSKERISHTEEVAPRVELVLIEELDGANRGERVIRRGSEPSLEAGSDCRLDFSLDVFEFVLRFSGDVVRYFLEIARDSVALDEVPDKFDARQLSVRIPPRRLRIVVALKPRVDKTVAGCDLRGRKSGDTGCDTRSLDQQNLASGFPREESRRQPDDASADDGKVDLLAPDESGKGWTIRGIEPKGNAVCPSGRCGALWPLSHIAGLPGRSRPKRMSRQ